MKQNEISQLPKLTTDRYENIFNVYQTSDGYYYYNIMSKVSLIDQLDPTTLIHFRVTKALPWTALSQIIYGSQYLWWLLCVVNKIQNPIRIPPPGTILTAIQPAYVISVLNEITAQL